MPAMFLVFSTHLWDEKRKRKQHLGEAAASVQRKMTTACKLKGASGEAVFFREAQEEEEILWSLENHGVGQG